MRGLAEYIMRGSKEATLVVALAAAIPLLFWVSAAALALVILRRGLNDALSVLVWGVLPALAWAAMGDPTPLLVILGSAGLAVILRESGQWSKVMLLTVPLGVAYALLLLTVHNEQLMALAGQIREMLPQMLSGVEGGADTAVLARLEALLVPILGGLLGSVHVLMVLVCLMLGRSWQARLYNPGGFRQEFHALRLSPLVAGGLLLLTLLGPQWTQLALLSPVASVPLLIAGLALVHGVVGIKNLGAVWLVAFYVLFVFMAQFAYPLVMFLAFVDSLFDFRSRMRPSSGPTDGDSNGHG
ncbi:hypothetical protein [Pseudomonas sp.]|uniref:hypothetical protein n=1 Tax=Pseudomonas sp. TaxID=306 RepID=UPI00272AD5B4|nr:hypothetical protein [Pseudomonas sp.]